MTLLLTDILTQSRICPCLRIIVKLSGENNNVEIQIQVAGDKGQYQWGRERIIASLDNMFFQLQLGTIR